ncbi:MAG TPA: leucine-rich repeat domain-containing protein [bacterium]|nr:leucine-rich repeat domain-containing protein [bacterium]
MQKRELFLLITGGLLFFSCESEVSFRDKELEYCVRVTARKTGDDVLTQSDLDKITSLTCVPSPYEEKRVPIDYLDGLDLLTNLEKIGLEYTRVSDISPLSKLKKLEIFGINTDRKINSYVPIMLLPLKVLGINSAEIEDISFLSYLPDLEEIYLRNNRIRDISVLSSLEKIKILDLEHNKIESIAPLAQHPNLANMTDVLIYYNCIDCMAEIEYLNAIAEKNPNLKYLCNPDDQLLPENCSE